MKESRVVQNIRGDELDKTIASYVKAGWEVASMTSASGPGYIGVSFVVIFTREKK